MKETAVTCLQLLGREILDDCDCDLVMPPTLWFVDSLLPIHVANFFLKPIVKT